MKQLLIAAAFAVASFATTAQSLGPMVTTGPVAWRGGEVRLGDAEARVRKVAGYPDRAVTLYQGDNYPIGELWMFIGDAKQHELLWVELIRGRVTRMWTEPIGVQQRKDG